MERPQEEMSFLDHLEVLRWHVIRSIVVVITVALLAFFFKTYIFKYVILPHTMGNFPTYKFFLWDRAVLRFWNSISDKWPFATGEYRIETMTGQFSATTMDFILDRYCSWVSLPNVWDVALYLPRALWKGEKNGTRIHQRYFCIILCRGTFWVLCHSPSINSFLCYLLCRRGRANG